MTKTENRHLIPQRSPLTPVELSNV